MISHISRMERLQILLAAGASYSARRLFGFGWWVGSKTAILGLRSILQPILGRYMNLLTYTLSCLIMLAATVFFGSASLLLVRLTWVLPGIVAGYVLRTHMKWLGVLTSLCAIILFIAHPEGAFAWQYSLYWCIPLVLCLFGADDILSRSLSGTLVAHAVGSVLWLYATNMPAMLWISLIPRVAYERGLLTVALVVAQFVVEHASEFMVVLQKAVVRLRLMHAS